MEVDAEGASSISADFFGNLAPQTEVIRTWLKYCRLLPCNKGNAMLIFWGGAFLVARRSELSFQPLKQGETLVNFYFELSPDISRPHCLFNNKNNTGRSPIFTLTFPRTFADRIVDLTNKNNTGRSPISILTFPRTFADRIIDFDF